MSTADIYALISFYLIAALGILGSLMYQLSPMKASGRFINNFGIDFQRMNTDPEKDQPGLKKFFSYFGSLLLGANYLALFTTWMAFHDHSRLAWWSLTYYPIMFLWHLLITRKEDKSKYLQLLFFLITLSALVWTYRTQL
jgi:hypothetical protein